MALELTGKVAIVTAAGQGVGAGAARALAAAGASVVVSSRTISKCEAVAAAIESDGGVALPVKCDVTVEADVDRCVETAAQRFGGIDLLVNAADDQRLVPFLQITEEDILAGVRTGVLGTVRFIQRCVPRMQERSGGAIVNVASGAGLLAMAGMGPYSANKEAIRSLTRTAAVELGPLGIRVNVICPTAWAPSFEVWTKAEPLEYQALLGRTPLGRIGDPVEDVGAGIVFLSSDQSRYVTGTTLMLDGGGTYLR